MKVIFIENIEDNKVGDIKIVADGYARNFLIPNKIAIAATPEEVKNIEKKMEKLKKEESEKVKELEEFAKKLSNTQVEIRVEVGPKDEEGNEKLFGSITNLQVEEALKEKGFEIDKKQIEIGEPIKQPGDYDVMVKLGHGVETEIKVSITSNK